MINSFEGEYAFLSNFYEHPISNGVITFPTNEHYFQAMKTLEDDERLAIARAATPGQAKRMGRSVKLRPDWESIKLDVMETAVRIKFTDPELAAKLIATGDEELIEGNWWNDTFWGVCNGVGENHLGKILMKVRADIK
jgi:ribA/ribD-fused uncharacterized protein